MVGVKRPVPDRWLSETRSHLGKALLVSALQVYSVGKAGKGEVKGSYQVGCIQNNSRIVAEQQNSSMLWVGMDPQRSSSPTPLQ